MGNAISIIALILAVANLGLLVMLFLRNKPQSVVDIKSPFEQLEKSLERT